MEAWTQKGFLGSADASFCGGGGVVGRVDESYHLLHEDGVFVG